MNEMRKSPEARKRPDKFQSSFLHNFDKHVTGPSSSTSILLCMLTSKMRSLVSKDRFRFQDYDHDLDQTYITKNIIGIDQSLKC